MKVLITIFLFFSIHQAYSCEGRNLKKDGKFLVCENNKTSVKCWTENAEFYAKFFGQFMHDAKYKDFCKVPKVEGRVKLLYLKESGFSYVPKSYGIFIDDKGIKYIGNSSFQKKYIASFEVDNPIFFKVLKNEITVIGNRDFIRIGLNHQIPVKYETYMLKKNDDYKDVFLSAFNHGCVVFNNGEKECWGTIRKKLESTDFNENTELIRFDDRDYGPLSDSGYCFLVNEKIYCDTSDAYRNYFSSIIPYLGEVSYIKRLDGLVCVNHLKNGIRKETCFGRNEKDHYNVKLLSPKVKDFKGFIEGRNFSCGSYQGQFTCWNDVIEGFENGERVPDGFNYSDSGNEAILPLFIDGIVTNRDRVVHTRLVRRHGQNYIYRLCTSDQKSIKCLSPENAYQGYYREQVIPKDFHVHKVFFQEFKGDESHPDLYFVGNNLEYTKTVVKRKSVYNGYYDDNHSSENSFGIVLTDFDPYQDVFSGDKKVNCSKYDEDTNRLVSCHPTNIDLSTSIPKSGLVSMISRDKEFAYRHDKELFENVLELTKGNFTNRNTLNVLLLLHKGIKNALGIKDDNKYKVIFDDALSFDVDSSLEIKPSIVLSKEERAKNLKALVNVLKTGLPLLSEAERVRSVELISLISSTLVSGEPLPKLFYKKTANYLALCKTNTYLGTRVGLLTYLIKSFEMSGS